MALELHITGPGLDALRQLNPGETELVLGRDVNCSVTLPDPERTLSRRHLAVWNELDEFHFRVLSTVNGVDMPFGYAPPGARGVLPPGDVLKLGEYSLEVRPLMPDSEQDAWAVLDQPPAASDATLPRAALVPESRENASPPVISADEDPFGDWGFESTFGPGSGSVPGGVKAVAQGPGTGDLSSFYKGLGLEPDGLAGLNPAELESVGRAVRVALEGLFELYASGAGAPGEPRGDDNTMVPVKDNNPLKTHWPAQTKLQYIFGGRAAGIGFVGPQRAVTDVVTELLAHEAALAAATRAVLDATLQEFAPGALKERLLGGGSKMFEGARAWEAYVRYYADRSEGQGEWVQQQLDKYFAQAYLQESKRIKRETGSGTE
jgi:predicted component of type VI protein secretion system